MNKVKLNELIMLEGWLENESNSHRKIAFPFYSTTGAEHSSVVFFELEPGHELGSHTDSAEEIVFILQGGAEITLGEESSQLNKDEMVLIPSMVPHNIRNIGNETLKVIGFFPCSNVSSTFTKPVMPINQKEAGAPPIPVDHPIEWNEVVRKIMPT
ncbi:cupin domain-containing protein [Lederbergia wuyishanensis]|uniref:Mannose-6-phosphate isomerase-like protein (Cupin superfamily) n=1 Tax=Lederbergia wuyishanensis TaxID=1347903 RepID=A0ABU0D4A0_9BACI|nr:cupin domain-containing protein [Lederbergia wuyishanensis]MCJ8008213.1 cupin domain-containing protein [Lederbergia wuyishanensis]MDQ0343198.1 mannose-6-phosphate isomerase-like protein (cupin superfamily) [Lederbergia wuyishanensis]